MSRALIIHHGGQRGRDGEWTADESRVLQATPLLRVLADHEVTWVTSRAAAPLLWSNPLIERIVTPTRQARTALGRERFDLVVNLDATPGSCALADRVRARRHAGYTWDAGLGRAHVRPTPTLGKPFLGRTYQDWLFALIDRPWSGERYVLGYRSLSQVRFDVGLNHLPAGGNPRQTWPASAWLALRRRLALRFAITLPVAGRGMLDFIDWVHSCRTVVTLNGLGLHAALAVGTRPVALLSPTDAKAVHLYGQGVAVTPPKKRFGPVSTQSDYPTALAEQGPPTAFSLADITPAAVDAAVETVCSLRRAG